ncbi:MAG: thiamine phosphate synthase [Deltaproteobacteria bacterium]|nr:thiamine phosphate synthase [Deltaproteobacteria bacterium]
MNLLCLPRIYPIIDDTYIPYDRMEETAQALIDGGARILQLRGKDISSAELLMAARSIARLTKKEDVIFIVNDRIDIALFSNADGVHIGQDDMPVLVARKLLGREKIIGFSTHSVKEAVAAEKLPVDYISFGPLFTTKSKKDAEEPKEVKVLTEVSSSVEIPIVAIGGIGGERIGEVLRSGANSVAMISDILSATDIKGKMKHLMAMSEEQHG